MAHRLISPGRPAKTLAGKEVRAFLSSRLPQNDGRRQESHQRDEFKIPTNKTYAKRCGADTGLCKSGFTRIIIFLFLFTRMSKQCSLSVNVLGKCDGDARGLLGVAFRALHLTPTVLASPCGSTQPCVHTRPLYIA